MHLGWVLVKEKSVSLASLASKVLLPRIRGGLDQTTKMEEAAECTGNWLDQRPLSFSEFVNMELVINIIGY